MYRIVDEVNLAVLKFFFLCYAIFICRRNSTRQVERLRSIKLTSKCHCHLLPSYAVIMAADSSFLRCIRLIAARNATWPIQLYSSVVWSENSPPPSGRIHLQSVQGRVCDLTLRCQPTCLRHDMTSRVRS